MYSRLISEKGWRTTSWKYSRCFHNSLHALPIYMLTQRGGGEFSNSLLFVPVYGNIDLCTEMHCMDVVQASVYL